MSVVDQCDWSKVKPTEEVEEDSEMDVHMKVQAALYDFEVNCNIIPNRIIMGCNLVDKIKDYSCIPIRTLEEMAKERRLGIVCEYEGIPVFVDNNNPNNLEVGYMVKWLEPKR